MAMTEQSPRRADSTVDRIADEIRRRLIAGEFAPGQRMIESEIASEFAVSRGPLREALSRLAAEGHLVLERNRGAVVRRMSVDDIRELYQLREILEGAAAGLAAAHIEEPGNRDRVRQALETNKRLSDTQQLREYFAYNEAYHALIVDLAGSSLLAETVANLRTRALRMQFLRLATAASAAQSAAQHEVVGQAILAGDAEAAERAMREHIRLSGEEVLSRHAEDAASRRRASQMLR